MTRTLSGARARQLRRREKRAARHVRATPMPTRPFRPSEVRAIATKQQLHDARATLGRLSTLVVRAKEQADRLERQVHADA